MKTYDLIMMSFDGATVKDSTHDTIDEAENAASNIGSKWFFYPFMFICSGSKIIETGEGLIRMSDKKAYSELMFKGRKIETVKRVFEKTFKLCDNKNADCYEFEDLMIETNRNLIRS